MSLARIAACSIAGLASLLLAAPSSGQSELKLLPSDGAPICTFGRSVSIDGDRALVGSDCQAAYVFDAATGGQIAKLVTWDPTAFGFGHSVSVSGNLALIGAPWAGEPGNQTGSAYVFDINTGAQLQWLVPSDGAHLDRFGSAVSLSGNLALVGAHEQGPSTGAAYLFDVTTGLQLHKLVPSNLAPASAFGYRVSVSGNLALVGVAGGPAFLFDVASGAELHKLVPDTPTSTVSVSGDLVLLGTPGDSEQGQVSGAAFVFDTLTGAKLTKLLPSDGQPWDGFGYAVALSGRNALVTSGAGSAYLFDAHTGLQLKKLTPSGGASDFGETAALSGTLALGGARSDNELGFRAGAAFLWLPLSTDVDMLSLSAGGTQTLSFNVGAPLADAFYLVVGTASGTQPGLPWDDFLLPLTFDAYTYFSLTSANQGPFVGTLGVIDPLGSGSAAIVLPPGGAASLAGLTLHHLAVALTPSGPLGFVTNAAPLTLVP